MYIRTCTDRLVLVALSAQPPGVNELCVCVSQDRTTGDCNSYRKGDLSVQSFGIYSLYFNENEDGIDYE
jgi:hypothetical protein